MSSADTETAEDQGPPPDEVRQGLLEVFERELGEAVAGSHIERGDIWVRVRADAWRRAAEVCRDLLDCDYFCFLSGIDWMPSSVPNPEEAAADTDIEGLGDDDDEPAADDSAASEPDEAAAPAAGAEAASEPGGLETGVAGGDTRFQVFARLYSTTTKVGVTLKADLDEDHPVVDSISELYRGADWHEREAREMYGFQFAGHPDPRNLLLPGEFEGHPLRKDFPLLAREVKPWPGLVDVEPMPEEDGGGAGAGEEA